MRVCRANGLGYGDPAECPSGQSCSGGSCVPRVCTPDAPAGCADATGARVCTADGLGYRVDEIRERFDRVATDRDLHVAFGTAEAGTCGALRTQAIAVIDGREAIIIEHVNRLAPDLGLEWGDRVDRPVYQVRIDGEPDIVCSMNASLRDPGAAGSTMDAGAGAMVSTAMRVVNAIPYVVQAEPGLLTALDLPLTVPRHALR